jgi:diketogulonate reductase-like aldo/keto reductase
VARPQWATGISIVPHGNEFEVGQSLQAILSSGIKREELWITSKLWNDKHAEGAL